MQSTQPPGLYKKFEVNRTDGRDQPGGDRTGAEYIVLDLTYCPFARAAALAYADKMAADYPQAAAELQAVIAALPPFPLKPHQQRVVDEKAELDERLQKLDAFTRTPTFDRLDGNERSLMLSQAEAMLRYSKILGARIEAFNT